MVQIEPLASFQRFAVIWTIWSMVRMVQMALVRFLLLDRYRIHRSGSDTDVCLPLRRFWPIMSLWPWTIERSSFPILDGPSRSARVDAVSRYRVPYRNPHDLMRCIRFRCNTYFHRDILIPRRSRRGSARCRSSSPARPIARRRQAMPRARSEGGRPSWRRP